MKILYFSPHPDLNLSDPAGYAVHMEETITSMKNLGHTVEVLISGGAERRTDQSVSSEESGLKRLVKRMLPNFIWQSLRDYRFLKADRYALRELRKCAQVFKPDLIYERGYYLMESGSRISNELNIPHIIELNAPYPDERISMGGRSAFIGRSIRTLKRVLKNSHGLVVVSSALKDFYTDKFDVDPSKIHVTSNGYRAERFEVRRTSDEVRKDLGIDTASVVFGFMGSVFPYHGIDRLIDAFIQVRASHSNVVLLIVGGGMIQEYQSKFSDCPEIIFTGELKRSMAIETMCASDIAIMANSNWYGSPIKIFEYGALGKCVIAPAVAPVKDVMEHEKDGILIEDLSQLTRAMLSLMNDSGLRGQLSKNWEMKVKERYHWDILTKRMLDEMGLLK